jgi:hypothetical protein
MSLVVLVVWVWMGVRIAIRSGNADLIPLGVVLGPLLMLFATERENARFDDELRALLADEAARHRD